MKSNVRTRLKTGDEVVVIAGRDVGKTGTITSIKKNKAFVTGINIVKKHTKSTVRDYWRDCWTRVTNWFIKYTNMGLKNKKRLQDLNENRWEDREERKT